MSFPKLSINASFFMHDNAELELTLLRKKINLSYLMFRLYSTAVSAVSAVLAVLAVGAVY